MDIEVNKFLNPESNEGMESLVMNEEGQRILHEMEKTLKEIRVYQNVKEIRNQLSERIEYFISNREIAINNYIRKIEQDLLIANNKLLAKKSDLEEQLKNDPNNYNLTQSIRLYDEKIKENNDKANKEIQKWEDRKKYLKEFLDEEKFCKLIMGKKNENDIMSEFIELCKNSPLIKNYFMVKGFYDRSLLDDKFQFFYKDENGEVFLNYPNIYTVLNKNGEASIIRERALKRNKKNSIEEVFDKVDFNQLIFDLERYKHIIDKKQSIFDKMKKENAQISFKTIARRLTKGQDLTEDQMEIIKLNKEKENLYNLIIKKFSILSRKAPNTLDRDFFEYVNIFLMSETVDNEFIRGISNTLKYVEDEIKRNISIANDELADVDSRVPEHVKAASWSSYSDFAYYDDPIRQGATKTILDYLIILDRVKHGETMDFPELSDEESEILYSQAKDMYDLFTGKLWDSVLNGKTINEEEFSEMRSFVDGIVKETYDKDSSIVK